MHCLLHYVSDFSLESMEISSEVKFTSRVPCNAYYWSQTFRWKTFYVYVRIEIHLPDDMSSFYARIRAYHSDTGRTFDHGWADMKPLTTMPWGSKAIYYKWPVWHPVYFVHIVIRDIGLIR